MDGYIQATKIQEVNNLFAFLVLPQVTENMLNGIFSITVPNLSKVGIEADATKGLGIGPGSTITANHKNKSYDFHLEMFFGGTFV